jgi:hypothetical protein
MTSGGKGDDLARAAELGGEVLELGQAVAHRQHRLGVVDVDARLEIEARNRRREDIDQAERRMLGQQMAAALRAVAALAEPGLREGRGMLGSGRDPHRVRPPQAERIDRPARPRAAGAAMAVAHGFRRAGDLELDRATEAASNVSHGFPSVSFVRREMRAGNPAPH